MSGVCGTALEKAAWGIPVQNIIGNFFLQGAGSLLYGYQPACMPPVWLSSSLTYHINYLHYHTHKKITMDEATNSNGSSSSSSSSSNSKNHYLRQTIAGVVCTKCIMKVNTSNTLFCINRRTIDRHWREKGCSDGNQCPATTAIQLEIRLKELHTRSQNNPALAMSDFR